MGTSLSIKSDDRSRQNATESLRWCCSLVFVQIDEWTTGRREQFIPGSQKEGSWLPFRKKYHRHGVCVSRKTEFRLEIKEELATVWSHASLASEPISLSSNQYALFRLSLCYNRR